MRKIVILTMGLISLFLYAFVARDTGIKKVGENLYTVTNLKRISPQESSEIKRVVTEKYGVKDFTKTTILSFQDGREGAKSLKSWFSTKVGPDWLDRDISPLRKNKDATSLVKILEKYSKI